MCVGQVKDFKCTKFQLIFFLNKTGVAGTRKMTSKDILYSSIKILYARRM
jgi:hypothetical protein